MTLEVLKKISRYYEYVTGRYECFIPTAKELQTCFEIRKIVFGEELKRVKSNYAPGAVDDLDDKSIHMACRDNRSGKIVGCMRFTAAHHLTDHPKLEKEFALKNFHKKLLPHVAVVTRLAVLKEHRKGLAGFMLASRCYAEGLNNHFVVSTIVCEPGLYPMYRKLGYRPLERVLLSPFGGYRLPLFLLLQDYSYLERCGSPFFKIAKSKNFPSSKTGLAWYQAHVEKNGVIAPGFTPVVPAKAAFHSVLTSGVSKKGHEELLKHALTIDCQYGDVVLAAGAGGRNMGFVIKGALEVRQKNKTLVILGEGDVFGEIAFILDVPRTADVIAASAQTEIVLLSLSAVEKMKKSQDQLQVWKNLSRLVASRLITKKED